FLRIAEDVVAARVQAITGSTSVYRDLGIAVFPSNLPYNLPLAELREYFTAAGTSLAAGYAAFLVPSPATSTVTSAELAAETLGLSPDQAALLVTPDATEASLAARYGMRGVATLPDLQRVAVFTDRTGLSYAELADLLTQQLSAAEVAAGAANSFFINATGENLPPLAIVVDDSIPASPYQKLTNVSDERYDRLDRFIRLSRHFGGSFASLDWAMKAAGATEITTDFLTNLAAVASLGSATGSGWDELAALQHAMKTIGKGDGRTPVDLFDRVFNNPRLLAGRTPSADIPFDPTQSYEWTIAETEGKNAQLRDRLAAALALSNPDVAKLGLYVAALQGKTTGKLSLDLATLSEFYRLAQSARLLKLDQASFFLVASLAFYPDAEDPALPPENSLPATLEAFQTLRLTIDNVRAAPFTLYQLQYIYTGAAGPYVSIGYRPDQIRTFINDLAETSAGLRLTAQELMFETIDAEAAQAAFDELVAKKFLTALGISLPKALGFDALNFLFPLNELRFVTDGLIDAAQSKTAFAALVAANLILPDPLLGESGVLSSAYTPATPLDFLFDNEPAAEAMRQQVREVLDQVKRNVTNTLATLGRGRALQLAAATSGLAEFLATTPELIGLLVRFATGAADVANYLADLLTPLGASEPPANVTAMIALLSRANMLFVTLDLNSVEINAVVSSPANFDISDTTGLTLDGIWSLVAFKGLVEKFQDVNDVIVRCYFGIAPQGTCANGTGVAALAYLTGWPAEEITALIALFWPDDGTHPPGWETVAGIVILNRVFELSRASALGVEGLAAIAGLAGTTLKTVSGLDSDAWDAFTAAAAAMKAALAARYGTEAFDVLYREIEGTLLTQQRDALNGFAVFAVSGVAELAAVDTIPKLSEYLLLDLQMSGCDSTSYIAQGIASVQAYMQRARMNLEPGVTDILVPESWWPWISGYRLWEANRKVYLYPENYVDPELLQGASPLYNQFKDEILQNEIDEPHVAQAYTAYFTGLAEQANLYPVSVYLSAAADARTGEETETHYLFGRTNTEPYTYFHRTLHQTGIWTPWQKIDLTINAAAISSVHAYGRLLIFWAETASESGAAIKAANAEPQQMINSTLRYSFVDAANTWIQPQTLVSDYVVAVHPNPYLANFTGNSGTYLASQYDETRIWWKLPHVYKLERGLTGAGRITLVADLNLAAG
ncbi:MAG: neuraminidase-like domain-containing protein, partial [Allosphingosinicella sp.]